MPLLRTSQAWREVGLQSPSSQPMPALRLQLPQTAAPPVIQMQSSRQWTSPRMWQQPCTLRKLTFLWQGHLPWKSCPTLPWFRSGWSNAGALQFHINAKVPPHQRAHAQSQTRHQNSITSLSQTLWPGTEQGRKSGHS